MSVEAWKQLSMKDLEKCEKTIIGDGVSYFLEAQRLHAEAEVMEGREIRTKLALMELQAYIEERRGLETAHD